MSRRLPRSERLLRQRLAANVRRLRDERGVSVQVIAERAEMHWRLWQKVEAGDTNATLQTIDRLAIALGVDPDELFASAKHSRE